VPQPKVKRVETKVVCCRRSLHVAGKTPQLITAFEKLIGYTEVKTRALAET
jgi:hypothetical protein